MIFFACIKNRLGVSSEMPRQITVAGIRIPSTSKTRKRPPIRVGAFFVPARNLMVGYAGASSEAPVPFDAGSANPAQSATKLISTGRWQVPSLCQRSLS